MPGGSLTSEKLVGDTPGKRRHLGGSSRRRVSDAQAHPALPKLDHTARHHGRELSGECASSTRTRESDLL
eukprot:2833966-Rhodomonas_salina.3